MKEWRQSRDMYHRATERAIHLNLDQRLSHHRARALDILGGMRRRNKSRFKLRRREKNAALRTSVKEAREHFEIASLRAGQIDNRSTRKKQTKHRTNSVKGCVNF